ncbi:MAG: ABC transporter ATP-binding protein [Acidobacteriia bacterium]|nr:ABC transporter ATP-binding protein [Terriglobia bacterium]
MSGALEFRSVRFAYREAPVFDGLTLELAEGEIAAVLGPNGTGKTTLVRLASASLRPDAGTILLRGRELAVIPAAERAREVAVVPQESRPAFDFTAREVVRMGRAPHLGLLGLEGRHDNEVVDEAMRRTAVSGLSERPFLGLSGGERQRVILARALAQEPKLLLLDEPTAFLDLRHRLLLYDLLTRLNRETGLTLLIASHDLNLAGRFADRIVLLQSGAVAADGPPHEVLTPLNLRLVYGVRAEVRIDPATGRPLVVPIAPADEA